MPKQIEVKTIEKYSYMCFSSRSGDEDIKAVIMLSEGNDFIGYLHFMSNGCVLPKAEKKYGLYYYYYHHDELAPLVDMLRNEQPVYLIYVEDDKHNCRISTVMEPVGEGEQ